MVFLLKQCAAKICGVFKCQPDLHYKVEQFKQGSKTGPIIECNYRIVKFCLKTKNKIHSMN